MPYHGVYFCPTRHMVAGLIGGSKNNKRKASFWAGDDGSVCSRESIVHYLHFSVWFLMIDSDMSRKTALESYAHEIIFWPQSSSNDKVQGCSRRLWSLHRRADSFQQWKLGDLNKKNALGQEQKIRIHLGRKYQREDKVCKQTYSFKSAKAMEWP